MYNFKTWMTSSKGSKACNLRDKTNSEINHLQFVCIINLLVIKLLVNRVNYRKSTLSKYENVIYSIKFNIHVRDKNISPIPD